MLLFFRSCMKTFVSTYSRAQCVIISSVGPAVFFLGLWISRKSLSMFSDVEGSLRQLEIFTLSAAQKRRSERWSLLWQRPILSLGRSGKQEMDCYGKSRRVAIRLWIYSACLFRLFEVQAQLCEWKVNLFFFFSLHQSRKIVFQAVMLHLLADHKHSIPMPNFDRYYWRRRLRTISGKWPPNGFGSFKHGKNRYRL